MAEILDILGGMDRIGFIPFALFDRAAYTAAAAARFGMEGIQVDEITADDDGAALLEEVPAIFVGGGNTFRLLKTLQDSGLLEVIRSRGEQGMVYTGASAGTNMAMPTIRTTNDMPIVEPDSFESLGLVPFQINPHYLDPDPGSTHMGETASSASRSSWKRTIYRWWDCARAPGFGSKGRRWSSVGATVRGSSGEGWSRKSGAWAKSSGTWSLRRAQLDPLGEVDGHAPMGCGGTLRAVPLAGAPCSGPPPEGAPPLRRSPAAHRRVLPASRRRGRWGRVLGLAAWGMC